MVSIWKEERGGEETDSRIMRSHPPISAPNEGRFEVGRHQVENDERRNAEEGGRTRVTFVGGGEVDVDTAVPSSTPSISTSPVPLSGISHSITLSSIPQFQTILPPNCSNPTSSSPILNTSFSSRSSPKFAHLTSLPSLSFSSVLSLHSTFPPPSPPEYSPSHSPSPSKALCNPNSILL